jgi:hypothetical protein
MRRDGDTLIVGKNRQRALWALVIVAFMSLASLVLILAGVLNQGEVLWTPVWLGTVGLLGFGASAAMIVQTMRSPWHLAVEPGGLRLRTQTYLLEVPWDNVAGIGVDEVNFREGCVLIFEDPGAAAEGTRFLVRARQPDIITDRAAMLARMEENYRVLGYHLGIPGRILEMGPQELARFLAGARTGSLWQDGGSTHPDGVPGRR